VTPRISELAEALALIAKLEARLAEAGAELASARERIAELEAQLGEARKPGPPSGVKANRPRKPPGERKPRKKRAENHGRQLSVPTEEVFHAVESCPDCGRTLADGWEHDRREVLDIPMGSYIVRHHVVVRRYCGVCGKEYVPKLDVSDEVLGQHRVSRKIMALVAYLKTVSRLPVAKIQELLRTLYGLHLSEGELTRLPQVVAERGRAAYEALGEELRSSAVVHADETGWREDGENGYLWVFGTPTVEYFHRDKSRASAIPLGILGERFAGVLVSDFYAAYGRVVCEKQRCWVHLLRDVKTLEETHPKHRGVARWRARIRAIYDHATTYQTEQRKWQGPVPRPLERERRRARKQFERALMKLARPYVKNPSDPRHILAKRIERFRYELFAFVQYPAVPSGNNAAERALRPSVIHRKVCGGTRSPTGSRTMAILQSLFGTWRLRGLAPLEACLDLLASTPA